MTTRVFLAACVLFPLGGLAALGQDVIPRPAAAPDGTPVLRLEGGGPTARVTALAFSPDGQTLYAAGYDKIVRAWKREPDPKKGFVLQPFAYRVPIGPGTAGAINCLAVSPDGAWVAAAGLGTARSGMGFNDGGRVFRIATPEIAQDRGTIYVFPTKPPPDASSPRVRLLHGQQGVVVALAFARPAKGKQPVLVSAAVQPHSGSADFARRVSVWDLSKGMYRDSQDTLVDQGAEVATLDLPDTTTLDLPDAKKVVRPGLAVRRTGAGIAELRVAIAWGDGQLRTWDVAAKGDRRVQEVKDGNPGWNDTVAYVGDSELVTGGSDDEGGYLRLWDDQPGRLPRPRDGSIPFRIAGYDYLVPRQLSVARTAAGGTGQAAVVLRLKKQGAEHDVYNLYLLSLHDRRVAAVGYLWDIASGYPILASSPGGETVAVAGAGRGVVRVYAAADLAADRDDNYQTLASAGALVGSVAFVRKANGPDLGLLLRASGASASGASGGMAKEDLVLDFARRSLKNDRRGEGWQIAAPADDGWSASEIDRARGRFSWEGPPGVSGKRLTVPLAKGDRITAYTLVPPPKGLIEEPLLAVATWNELRGEPLLALYRATDKAEPVRWFTGHVQPIHDLAASRDGRLLASVADDRTISIWSLTDLGEIIGKHGTLAGVDLREEQGPRLVVENVEPGSPAAKVLGKGDTITALGLNDRELKPLTGSALEFCDALWGIKPGETIRLTIQGGKARPQTVPVVTGQGIDNRNPLLSLFITGQEKPEPEWIAWTPQGPYDCRGADIESDVGWHFNPSKLGQPVRFAALKASHKDFYEPNLLKPLLAHGSLEEALKEIRPKKRSLNPRIRIDSVADQNQPDAEGQYLVRDPDVELRLTVGGVSLADGDVKSITVAVDGKEEPLNLDDASGQSFAPTLNLGKRGLHKVRVTLKPVGNGGEVSQELAVRYQPPPPEIEFPDGIGTRKDVRDGKDVHDGKYRLQVRVKPSPRGGRALASATLGGNPVSSAEVKDSTYAWELELRPDENVVKVQAVSAEALPGYEKYETSPERTLVLFRYAKDDTPRPVFTAVELGPDPQRSRNLPVEGRPLVVDARKVWLVGNVGSEKPLTVLSIRTKSGDLVGSPKAGKGGAFRYEMTLEQDRYDLVLVAKTATSDKGTASLRIEYRPPPPELLALKAPQDRDEFFEAGGPPEVKIEGVLTLPDAFEPYKAVVEVSRKDGPAGQQVQKYEKAFDKEVGQEGQPVNLGKVPLQHGVNRLRVHLENEWGRTSQVIEREVSYLRPPIVLDITPPGAVSKPVADIRVEVQSPADLPLTKFVVDGREYRPNPAEPTHLVLQAAGAGSLATVGAPIAPMAQVFAAYAAASSDALGLPNQGTCELVEKEEKKGVVTWRVRIKAVPLKNTGRNLLNLVAYNEDGHSPEGKKEVEVVYNPPAPPPAKPVISVRSAPVTKDPNYELKLTIESPSSLRRVEIVQGGHPIPVDVSSQRKDDLGFFELRDVSVNVRLNPGTNLLEIKAENEDGGREVKATTVVFSPPPVRLVVDPHDDKAGAELQLAGRIIWTDPGERSRVEAKVKHLHVYVNGHLQRPAELTWEKDRPEVRFAVKAVLNQAHNRIRVECPDLPEEAGGQQVFQVDSDNPQKPGKLRLMIVNAADIKITGEELVTRALRTLQLEAAEGKGLQSRVFSEVKGYPYSLRRIRPLADYTAVRPKVEAELDAMRRDIEKDGSPSDVVLIYWLGREAVKEDGEWYLPTNDTDMKRLGETALPLRELLNQDGNVLGARVVLLDVTAPAPAKGAQPGFEWHRSRAAVLHYAWSRKEGPQPELLKALESAARESPDAEVLLRDVAKAAEEHAETVRKQDPDSLHYISSLFDLAGLVVTGKPKPPQK